MITVRTPEKLKKEAEDLVEQGYFKNVSEIMVTGMRKTVQEYSKSRAVNEVRKFRDEQTKKALKQAGGDKKKAAEIIFNQIKNSQE